MAVVSLREVRLPRFVLGVFAGLALGLAGAILQGTFRNSLAGPELLGVTGGASVAMAVIIVWGVPITFIWHPWIAMAGALLGGAVTLGASGGRGEPVRLVLVGAAVAALLQALVYAIISFGEFTQVPLLFQFLFGSLSGRTWDYVGVALPWLLVAIPLALLTGRMLNVLQLGDDMAEGLGLPVVRVRLGLLAVGVTLVGAVVAVCGPLSFVALLSPHLARRLTNSTDYHLVLPTSALVGAVVLTSADVAARVTFAPIELPVGACTTLVGGPLLLIMLRSALRTPAG